MNESTAATNVVRHDAESVAATFPALLVEARRVAQTVSAGLHGRRRAGPGETFWQHRPYAFGDPVSVIDWRQSARIADRLYVRENEWEIAAAVYLWRDPSKSLDFSSSKQTPTKRRRADVLATALSVLLSEAGERIGLLGEERRLFHGRNAPMRLLEALHIGDFEKVNAPPRAAHLQTGASVVLISDFYTDESEIAAAVAKYAGDGANGALLQLCDFAEEEFPFEGRTQFLDPEGADKLIFGETVKLAKKYHSAFAGHRDALRNIAEKAGWTFISHRTDKPPQTALLALYNALADARAWNI